MNSHKDNLREIEGTPGDPKRLGYIKRFNQRIGYLKACKQTEKEINNLKEGLMMEVINDGSAYSNMIDNFNKEMMEKVDKFLTHKEALEIGVKNE